MTINDPIDERPYNEERVIRELEAFNTMIRGFCESLDCGDLSCGACPLGPEVCLVLGNDNLRKKYGGFLIPDLKNISIIILIILLIIAWT